MYRSRRNVLLMLAKQGYDTREYEDEDMAMTEAMMKSGALDMTMRQKEEAGGEEEAMDEEGKEAERRQVTVWYCAAQQFSKPAAVLEKVEQLRGNGMLRPQDTLYIVGPDDPKDRLTILLNDLWARAPEDRVFVAVTTVPRTQIDWAACHGAFKHTRLTAEQTAEIEARFEVPGEPGKLPEISRHDPGAVYIALRPGEICHVARPKGDFYRRCISDACRKSNARAAAAAANF